MKSFKQYLESIEDEFHKDIENDPQTLSIYADYLEEHGKPIAAIMTRLFVKGKEFTKRLGNGELCFWIYEPEKPKYYVLVVYGLSEEIEAFYYAISYNGKIYYCQIRYTKNKSDSIDIQESDLPEEFIKKILKGLYENH